MGHTTAFFSVLFTLVTTVASQENVTCPVGTITMSGAEGAERVVETWKEAYLVKCPELDIETFGGGYPMGAARVCGNHSKCHKYFH